MFPPAAPQHASAASHKRLAALLHGEKPAGLHLMEATPICTEQIESDWVSGSRTRQWFHSSFKIKDPVPTRNLQHNKVRNIDNKQINKETIKLCSYSTTAEAQNVSQHHQTGVMLLLTRSGIWSQSGGGRNKTASCSPDNRVVPGGFNGLGAHRRSIMGNFL